MLQQRGDSTPAESTQLRALSILAAVSAAPRDVAATLTTWAPSSSSGGIWRLRRPRSGERWPSGVGDGVEHPDVAHHLGKLGNPAAGSDQETLAGAEAAQRRALGSFTAVFGEHHPNVRHHPDNLGNVRSSAGSSNPPRRAAARPGDPDRGSSRATHPTSRSPSRTEIIGAGAPRKACDPQHDRAARTAQGGNASYNGSTWPSSSVITRRRPAARRSPRRPKKRWVVSPVLECAGGLAVWRFALGPLQRVGRGAGRCGTTSGREFLRGSRRPRSTERRHAVREPLRRLRVRRGDGGSPLYLDDPRRRGPASSSDDESPFDLAGGAEHGASSLRARQA